MRPVDADRAAYPLDVVHDVRTMIARLDAESIAVFGDHERRPSPDA
jgi:hypothetical protein